MAIQDDILRLKQMQEQHFAQYGQYFETDGKIPKQIPTKDSDAEIGGLKRFKGNQDCKAPSNIDFKPTAKDFQISIGQVVFVNSAEGGYEEGAEKQAYIITVSRRLTNDIIERYITYGGDPEVILTIKGEVE